MALPLSYNLRNIRVRWKVTLLAVLGIALVVVAFVVLLAMDSGLQYALRSTGAHENAIITQKGSASELTSSIQKEQCDYILVDPSIQRLPSSNTPMASLEMVVVANLPLRDGRAPVNVTIRGVTEMAFHVRSGIKTVQGRQFQPGLYEIMVGKHILLTLVVGG